MAKNTKGEQSKNNIIECAAKLFMQKGYNATGINEILECTGLPKGSFYFHFKSKKELALSVSLYFDKVIGDMVLASARSRRWKEFITDLLDKMIDGAEKQKHYGCPFAVLGLEIAFSEPDLAMTYNKSLEKLICLFNKVLIFSGVEESKAGTLANRAFAIYEGYLVHYRVSKEVEVLKRMKEDLISVYSE